MSKNIELVEGIPHNDSLVQMTVHEGKDDDVKGNLEECNITLFTENRRFVNGIFVVESMNSAVMDTACTQTVCGEKCYINMK